MNGKKAMAGVVALIVKDLDDLELAVLNNIARCDFNPKGRIFDYERVKGLFTEDNGLKMHDETKEALARVVIFRLVERS